MSAAKWHLWGRDGCSSVLGTTRVPDVTVGGRGGGGLGKGREEEKKLTACVLVCLGGWSPVMVHVSVLMCTVRI